MTPELSIVIPAYNEEKRLPPTLERIFSLLSSHHREKYEILVVDDGSRDATVSVVEDFVRTYPQIRLLRFPRNRGYGAAVREGVLSSNGDYVLAMDADGSANEEAIIRFLNFLRSNPRVGFAVGSRTIEGSQIVTQQPILRVVLGNAFLFFAKIFFGWPMEDRINGFKMFRREAAEDIFPYQYEDSVLGAAEVVYVAEQRGWKYELLPIRWTDYRGSKIQPLRDSWHSFWGVMKIAWRGRRGIYVSASGTLARQNVKSGALEGK